MDSQPYHYYESDNENKILDLTSHEDGGGGGEGPGYICDHCEIPMLKPNEDLSSAADGSVVVKPKGKEWEI